MGLEPTTSAVTGRRSNQLSHRAKAISKEFTFLSGNHTLKTEPDDPHHNASCLSLMNRSFPYSGKESFTILSDKAVDVLRRRPLTP